MKNLSKIRKRIEQLKIEIVHSAYYDGWTLKGMKKELKELESLLAK